MSRTWKLFASLAVASCSGRLVLGEHGPRDSDAGASTGGRGEAGEAPGGVSSGGTSGGSGGSASGSGGNAGETGGSAGDSGGTEGGAGGSGGGTLAVESLTAYEHTCALLTGGVVRCWGNGGFGRLGYGNESFVGGATSPAAAGNVDVGGAVVQVVAGGFHTCALLEGGSVRCWGNSESGQLGYGTTSSIGDDELPASAGDVDVGGAVVQLSAGSVHTCALLTTGAVRCWGEAVFGQVGAGSASENVGDDEVPASIPEVDLGARAIRIASGGLHNCAVLEGGALRCWGFGEEGQLGYGRGDTIGDDEAPATVGPVDVGGEVEDVGCGYRHTCALLRNGSVRCWGAAPAGRLGYPGVVDPIGDDETPASAGDVDLGGAAVDLEVGSDHTCVRLATGTVRCWGFAGQGKLGYGSLNDIGDDETPAQAGDVNVGGPVRHVVAGLRHTCAVLESGPVRCWGAFDPLGYGTTNNVGDDETPAEAGDVPLF